MPIPTAVSIELTDDERSVLESWTRRRTSAQALALRARIVLMAAEGLWSNGEIAEALAVSRPTVTKWRNRFAQRRLEGLADEPRPGKPRTITDEQVEAVVTKTLESAPKNATHWSTRSMAREVGMTPDAVMRIWHAFGLQPHRQDTWKLSKDPLLIEKVHDICGLYMNPPERAVVLCVDEPTTDIRWRCVSGLCGWCSSIAGCTQVRGRQSRRSRRSSVVRLRRCRVGCVRLRLMVVCGRGRARVMLSGSRSERENRELRRANDILKAASAFFARELDPQPRR
jgi:transposase